MLDYLEAWEVEGCSNLILSIDHSWGNQNLIWLTLANQVIEFAACSSKATNKFTTELVYELERVVSIKSKEFASLPLQAAYPISWQRN